MPLWLKVPARFQVLLAAALLALGGCDASTTLSGEAGRQCTTDRDCATGKVCDPLSFTCSTPGPAGAGADATASDAVGCAAGERCDDGNPCTRDDTCEAGVCLGEVYDCDDGLACTADACLGNGTCSHAPEAGTCLLDGACVLDGVAKTDDPCRVCLAAASPFAWSPASDGGSCDDGLACTTGDACWKGACRGVADPATCDDGNECTDDTCEAPFGCRHAPAASTCDDGNPCTVQDHCSSGTCAGGVAICQCAADKDCASLDDGDACTGILRCTADRICKLDLGAVPDCDDADPCTADACKDGACTHSPLTGEGCTDGDACTEKDVCTDGTCGGTLLDCDDNDPCTTDLCDPKLGCAHAPIDPCPGGGGG